MHTYFGNPPGDMLGAPSHLNGLDMNHCRLGSYTIVGCDLSSVLPYIDAFL